MTIAKKLRTVCVAALASALLVAAPAAADDASMKRAWDSQDPAFTELSKSVNREIKAWAKRGHTRDSKLLRLFKRGETLTARVEQAVNAEQPSSPQGTEAKPLIMNALATLKQHFVWERKAVRAAPSKRAERYGKEADRLWDVGAADAKKARDLLAQVGVQ